MLGLGRRQSPCWSAISARGLGGLVWDSLEFENRALHEERLQCATFRATSHRASYHADPLLSKTSAACRVAWVAEAGLGAAMKREEMLTSVEAQQGDPGLSPVSPQWCCTSRRWGVYWFADVGDSVAEDAGSGEACGLGGSTCLLGTLQYESQSYLFGSLVSAGRSVGHSRFCCE